MPTALKKVSSPNLEVTESAVEVPAERVSSSDHIVDEIKQGLYWGRYVPGQQLTENDLTRRFRVGRGSVREALKRLAAEGVVIVSLHRGARIRSMTRKGVFDVLEVTEALSALAARRAAERELSASELRALRAVLKSLPSTKAAAQLPAAENWRRRFYQELGQISGNPELERIILTVQSDMIRMQFRPGFGPEDDRHHAKTCSRVIEAILAKEPVKAERAMRQHVRKVSQVIAAMPDDLFAL